MTHSLTQFNFSIYFNDNKFLSTALDSKKNKFKLVGEELAVLNSKRT